MVCIGVIWFLFCVLLVPGLAATTCAHLVLSVGFLALNLLVGHTSVDLSTVNHSAMALMYLDGYLTTKWSGGWG